jgi:hypothetical protein
MMSRSTRQGSSISEPDKPETRSSRPLRVVGVAQIPGERQEHRADDEHHLQVGLTPTT